MTRSRLWRRSSALEDDSQMSAYDDEESTNFPSECDPLLADSALANTSTRTHLPVEQIAILMFLRFCESASLFSIYPFLEELLRSVLGGAEEKVGHYAGLMEFIRNAISVVTSMYWSRMSDKIGRRPILLLGTTALSLSMLCFGVSKTFVTLVLSRCIFTALNSNAGTIKSVIGEITDDTNSADAFALLHVPWAAGSSFGSLVGGWLADPRLLRERYRFFERYPYFLPCTVMALLCGIGVVVIAVGLNETLPKTPNKDTITEETNDTQSLLPTSSGGANHDAAVPESAAALPVPFTELLTFPVLLPLFNYVTISFLHTASNSILPLHLALPIRLGGIGLRPSSIGTILSIYGAVNSIFQAVFLGRFVRRFGAKTVFVTAICAFLPFYAMYVVSSIIAGRLDGRASVDGSDNGTSTIVYLLVAIQLGFSMIMECGYGCIYMFITAGSPNKQSLGSTNGLGQTMVSIVRMVAPAFAGSLMSFSIERQWLWGYAVYAVLGGLASVSILLARKLPARLSRDEDR